MTRLAREGAIPICWLCKARLLAWGQIECLECGYIQSGGPISMPTMMPGETPYTPREYVKVLRLIADAAAGDPGEWDGPGNLSPEAEVLRARDKK